MKMKLKMSMVVGTLALAVAGQAGAVTLSDLFLTVVDTNTTTGSTVYTRDLGSFLGTISGTNSATLAASSAGDHTFAADANLASFLSGVVSGDSVVWNVTAAFTGATGFDASGIVSTSTVAAMPSNQLNGTVNSGASALKGYYNGLALYETGGLLSGSTTGTTNLLSAAETGNSGIKFSTLASIGSSMDMWYITPSSTGATAKVASAIFGGAGTADVWTLGSNGALSVAAVAAVPEPGEWLLMLSGFGLIGFVASRRKGQGSGIALV